MADPIPHDDTTGTRLLRGAVAGLVAGVVASFAMDRFQAAVAAARGGGGSGGGGSGGDEPATARAADRLAAAAGRAPVAKADWPLAGQAVHYALGTGLGVAYGIAAEFRPGIAAGGGAAFGLGVAGLLDEAAVPAAGLGPAPWRTPFAIHLYGAASHLVFGAAAELTRRQVRATLLPD